MMRIFKSIFNPQGRFQENHLLIFGCLSFILGSGIAYFCGATYDGIFDVHLPLNGKISLSKLILENAINVICVFVLLFIFGKIINPKTRWIDILNASLLYRIPIYISVFFTALPVFNHLSKMVQENQGNLTQFPFSAIDLVQILVASMLIMLLFVYAIVLLVNGFKTATNTKKWQHFVVFTFLLIIAEIISKILMINM